MNDLSLHILDILQNSLSAGATAVSLLVEEDHQADRLTITIGDNGRGMDAGQLARVTDPFFTSRTTRRVGMGLPLYRQTARQSGGDLHIESEPGKGTLVTAWFSLTNIDRPPLGDVANAVVLTVSANPLVEMLFTYRDGSEEYVFDTREVRDALEGIPLSEPSVALMLEEMIKNNLEGLKTA